MTFFLCCQVSFWEGLKWYISDNNIICGAHVCDSKSKDHLPLLSTHNFINNIKSESKNPILYLTNYEYQRIYNTTQSLYLGIMFQERQYPNATILYQFTPNCLTK